MLKRSLLIITLQLLAIIPLCSAFAVPIQYTVSGNAYYGESGELLTISGEMHFDDVVDYYDSGQPVFVNDISYFNINIGSHAFTGSGSIRSIHYPGYYTTPFDALELRGTGEWSRWSCVSYGVDFFSDNGSAFDKGQDPSDFYEVPYEISAPFLQIFTYGGPALALTGLDIARGGAGAAPVPEPATILLMLAGLTGVAGVSRRKHKMTN